MKAPDFAYARPETLEAALEVLAEAGTEARLLAGGQSLMPILNFRMAEPAVLIDINRVPGLSEIEIGDEVVRIGALTRHAELEHSAVIAEEVALIAAAMPHIGHLAIRSRGTIGGSLALADPAAELPACMLALDAVIVAQSARGERRIAVGDYFRGLYDTALVDDEMIVAVEVPRGRSVRHALREIARRHGDYATVGVALTATVGTTLNDPRVVFFGVADRPLRVAAAEAALAGAPPGDPAAAHAAAATLDDAVETHGDLGASSVMKLHLAKVLLVRAAGDLAGRQP